MVNFDSLAEIDGIQSQEKKARQELFDWHMTKALRELKLFTVNLDKVFLEEAVSELLKALTYKKDDSDTYLYLAYAMFVVDAADKGYQYLKKAKSLDAANPLIQKLQLVIESETDQASQTMAGELAFFEEAGFF